MNFKLFFGFPLDDSLSKILAEVNPQLLAQLIKNDQDYYLNKYITLNGQTFIGKWIKNTVSLEELENIANHILSIFKQLVPDSSLKSHSLLLIPEYIQNN